MFDETLEKRIALCFEQRGVEFETKRMFGGVCFLVAGKMCVGIVKDSLMVRFDPSRNDEILEHEGARAMDFTKRTMKGFAFVDVENTKNELSFWIGLALEFNPRAKSSKKEKK